MSTTELPPIDTERTLADLVSERPARARVFEHVGLDYCCKGRRSLADAAADAGLDVDMIAARLARITDASGTDVDQLGPVALVHYIVETHHRYLHEELPLVHALATKVHDVHGARHPELARVEELVAEIRADLEPHLRKEEKVLFPAIRRLAEGPCDLPFGSVADPISVMIREHDRAGELLEQLREATDGYAPPVDGCASYRNLYARLAELERDTHRHVHLENNVLFPAVVALEA